MTEALLRVAMPEKPDFTEKRAFLKFRIGQKSPFGPLYI
jgi:hypothetical protein